MKKDIGAGQILEERIQQSDISSPNLIRI